MPTGDRTDKTAYEGPCTAAETENGPKHALDLAAFLGRVEIRYGGHGDGDQYASAEPLDPAADDHHMHAGGEPCGHGTLYEEDQTGYEKRFPAVSVGKLSCYRYDGRFAQEIGRYHPGIEVHPLQVAGDLITAGADDRAVEAGNEHPQGEARHLESACSGIYGIIDRRLVHWEFTSQHPIYI